MREKTKESTVCNIPPIRHTAVSGIFMLISCVYIVFILYLSCATPLSPAMHAQLRHKITFRLYMIYLPDHSRIYRNCTNPLQPIYLVPCMCLSCVTILIARHATRYPTTPPTTPPLPHKPFPEIPQIPPLYRKTAPPNRRQQLKHAQLSTYLSHLYCAYHMLFLCLPCVTAYSRIYFT